MVGLLVRSLRALKSNFILPRQRLAIEDEEGNNAVLLPVVEVVIYVRFDTRQAT